MNRRCWRYLNVCYRANLKLSVVAFIVAIAIGELGCFLWAYLTWRVPASSEDSLGLLLVSDSQIQGFRNEPPGIVGYITRLDADWYLWKVFRLMISVFSPDAVIHLGDIFDEGNIATDEEFVQYKARHDRIFSVPLGVPKIHVAGDNDIGGEGMDRITKRLVSRFSHHFGSVNDVIELKSYQIIKVNSLILQSRPLRQEEWSVYNKTSTFIEELPSRLNRNKSSILIGHILLYMIESKTAIKLIKSVQPKYAFSGHIHKSATIYHRRGSVTVTEYVLPTCSYRMGTNRMGAAIAVLGADGSMDYSVLSFPTRYTFFYIYLLVLVNCLIMRLAFLKKSIEIIYNALSRSCCTNKIHKI
ncbi:metallophosphoesterase 1 homolog isoform X1 [Acropora palmata]|uniref:metallophosphoesterase 1 homolog isoform X1 n=1 Tax=Acropora palmata TaxID=6131 RepID=UPI003DA0A62B